MSTALVQPMTEDAARRITERIRATVVHTRESIEKIQRLLTEAKDGGAHLALGYGPSEWTKYMADLFADQPLRLPRDQRQELVGYLAGEGMSTRAIAAVTGTSHWTVQQDQRSGGRDLPPEPPLTDEPGRVMKLTGEGSATDYSDACKYCGCIAEDCTCDRPFSSLPAVDDDATGEEVTSSTATGPDLANGPDEEAPDVEVERSPAPSRPAVTGLDGKTYTQREQRKPRRKPLTDQARDAGWELRKSVERLERIAEDDRFPLNKDQMASHLRGHLTNAIEVCQDLLDRINTQEESTK